MRGAAFALLLAAATALPLSNRTSGDHCRCHNDVPVPFTWNETDGAVCSVIGDPHVTTFDEHTYDFMGEGTFQLFKATTSCGCDVEVQTFHESSTQLIGIPPLFSASAVTAVAMSAGNATLWINANLHLRVVGETSLTPDDAGEEGVVHAGVLCRKKTATKGSHTVAMKPRVAIKMSPISLRPIGLDLSGASGSSASSARSWLSPVPLSPLAPRSSSSA